MVATSGLVALITLVAVPAERARASNNVHPRTPVVWTEAPCIQTVDRSVEALLDFDYTIPFEDTNTTFDEFEDSRTHQFIALCRQYPAGEPPPPYVSVDDLERSIDAGLELGWTLADAEATLETSEVWAGCWARITPDDQRRPITWEAAAEPVVWDTSELSPGTWVAAGYTWEPPLNLWRRAPWVVRVLDSADDPAQAAASLGDTPDGVEFDEAIAPEVCVEAEPGATVTLQWRVHDAELWSDASSAAVEVDTPVELPPFVAPEPAWGETIVLRAQVAQPGGDPTRDYVADALASVVVFIPPDDETGDSGGGGDEGDEGDETDTQGTGGETSEGQDTDTSETGSPDPANGDGTAGRCSLAPERGKLAGLGLLLLLLGYDRRRRSQRRSTTTRP